MGSGVRRPAGLCTADLIQDKESGRWLALRNRRLEEEQGAAHPIPSSHSRRNRLARLVWGIVWAVLFRPSPTALHCWRRALLRAFGASIGSGVHVYPSAKVWAPWRLVMGDNSCLGPQVDCYNVGGVEVAAGATVSQYSYLCGATHNYRRLDLPLVTGRITLGPRCWVGADAFVGPGVTIGEGSVVGARASVYRDVAAWVVVVGNPAKVLKGREMEGEGNG